MKTAVVYARYSCDSQTEQSIEGQLRVCEQFAKNNDIAIVNTYIDRAMTGTNDQRPSFQQMLKDATKKEWNFILVYKLDRFSRNKYESVVHKKTLKENGIKVISAMENIPDTPEGIILESLLEGMNQYYSAELSQKVKRGMNETRLKGNFTGGHLLYGYKVENHKIIIDEEQAEVVRYIYKQYALGVYVKDIIQYLTQNHIFNHGKPFTQNTIYNILKNEKYFGIFRHNNEVFTNIYPAIISTEIYEQVRNKINLNRYGKRSTEVDYLLRNKLECGYCGKTMSAECGVSKTGKKLHYYKCLGRKKQNGCHKDTIRKEFIEDLVIKKVLEILQSPKYINAIIDKILLVQNNQTNSPLLTSLLKEQKQTQHSLNNLLSAVEQGVVNNTTNKRMKDLENKLLELDKSILIERSKSTQKLTRQEISNYYLDALKLSSKLLIDYLINKIIVYDDKIIIKLNSPIKTSPEPQGFSFDLKFTQQ